MSQKIRESFRVIIQRTTVYIEDGQEHKVIETRPYTDEEIADMNRYDREKYMGRETPLLKDVYGYADTKKQVVDKDREIYKQEFDTLDIKKIIEAANA